MNTKRILFGLVGLIGLGMIVTASHDTITPPLTSGVAFALIGISAFIKK